MSLYRLVAGPETDLDVETAYAWYEEQLPGLGLEFLDELRASYRRVAQGPYRYHELRAGIRRSLLRRFPYAVYFAVEGEVIVVLAVLHVGRDPRGWQQRG